MISDLVDYLHNNLLIAHFCGFDISRPLPSYWTFDRFLKNFDNKVLSEIMKTQVLFLSKEGIVDTSFIGLDSTAHFCGFDISRPLPSYWTFDRFLKNFDNKVLSEIMKTQVLFLSKEGIVDTSIGLDSTPVSANTSQNNPKSFLSNKFKPGNQPRADSD